MPLDVRTHTRDLLRYNLVEATSSYMLMDLARLVADYCVPADPLKTLKPVNTAKGYEFKHDAEFREFTLRGYSFAPTVLDIWGEPVSTLGNPEVDPRAVGLVEKLERKIKPGGLHVKVTMSSLSQLEARFKYQSSSKCMFESEPVSVPVQADARAFEEPEKLQPKPEAVNVTTDCHPQLKSRFKNLSSWKSNFDGTLDPHLEARFKCQSSSKCMFA
jgi:hypothetical protein